MRFLSSIVLLTFFINTSSFSQISWDDTTKTSIKNNLKKVHIKSSFDSSIQPAIIHRATVKNRPLLISLHTWSGNYQQTDSVANYAVARNWNYIFPKF